MLLPLAACSCAPWLFQSKNFPVISLHICRLYHMSGVGYKGTCIHMRLPRQMLIGGHWPGPMGDTPIDLLRLWVATPKYQFALIRLKNENFNCTISAKLQFVPSAMHSSSESCCLVTECQRCVRGNGKIKRRKVWVTKQFWGCRLLKTYLQAGHCMLLQDSAIS